MEQNKLTKSNKLKLIIVTSVLVLIAIAGLTYAYFTIQIVGNDTASSMRLLTADLSLIYTDIQVRSGSSVKPGWTETKTLTVENDGTKTVEYAIVWRELYNELINDELVIEATCASSSGTCPNISRTVVPTETTEASDVLVSTNISIASGVTHTYSLPLPQPRRRLIIQGP